MNTESSRLFSRLPPVLVIGAGWFWLAVACAVEWSGNSEYSHGWVVLPLAIYFLWKRWETVSPAPTGRAGRLIAWTGLLGGALWVLPLELGRLAPLYWRVFPWGIFGVVCLMSLSCAYLAGGRPFAMAGVFPLVFLASGIPWPTAFELPLTLGLMRMMTSFLVTVLPMAGIPAQQEGTTIVLLNCTVGMEEACSGIRSLQSSVMLALAAGEMLHLRSRDRVFLLAGGFVLAMVSNVGRTLVLTLAGVRGGVPAMDRIHDGAGMGALIFLTAGVFLAAWRMRRPGLEQTPLRDRSFHFVPVLPLLGVLVLGTSGFFLAKGWYVFHEARVLHREGVPFVSIRVSEHVRELPLPPGLQERLEPDSGSFARMVLANGEVANGFHFFWNGSRNNAGKLYHRPDSCMPEGGWVLDGPESNARGMLGEKPVEWKVLPYEKGGRRALLLWAAWLDGQPISLSMNTVSGVQRNNLWRLIANGRRTFSYETAAVLVPYSGSQPPVAEAVRVAGEMFSHP